MDGERSTLAPAEMTVSLCYDEDTTWWNGNEHWIEIDQAAAMEGV